MQVIIIMIMICFKIVMSKIYRYMTFGFFIFARVLIIFAWLIVFCHSSL